VISFDFEVKTYDIDFAGVVSNLVYLRWLEDLRMAYLSSAMSLEELVSRHLFPTLVHTTINYRGPVRFPDHVIGEMRFVEAGTTSLTLEATFRSRKSGAIVADARQVGLILDGKTGRPVAVPDELLRLLPDRND
jgi:acyl-CoA thioester hydrolase